MKRLIGLWIWTCLLWRRLLSVLGSVYDIANMTDQPAVRRPFTPAQRIEMHMLLDLILLLRTDLRANMSSRIYASDASMTGGMSSTRNKSKRAECRSFPGLRRLEHEKGGALTCPTRMHPLTTTPTEERRSRPPTFRWSSSKRSSQSPLKRLSGPVESRRTTLMCSSWKQYCSQLDTCSSPVPRSTTALILSSTAQW